MKSLFLFTLFILASLGLFVQDVHAKFVEHKVQDNETVWFISQVYFGKGARYAEILKANQMSSAKAVKPGMVLKIEDPKFDPETKEFSIRLASLRKKRLEQLGLHYNEADQAKKVVVPSKKIQQSDSSRLPFSEVRDPQQSLQEQARDELKMEMKNQSSEAPRD